MDRIAKQTLDRFLLQVVDGCLAGVIFFVPLLMGGRHAIGQLALTALAVAAAWAWAVRQCFSDNPAWRPARATGLLLVGLTLVALQCVPLPPQAIAWLAPHTAAILPLGNATCTAATGLGAWHYASFTPAETQAGLVLFLDFALLFFVAAQRLQHIEDVERVLRWCAVSAACMAVFGIVQFLTSNGNYFWFYEHPGTTTSDATHGSFSNRNHFAHFLALGTGPLIWWLQDVSRRTRTLRRGTQAAITGLGAMPDATNTYLLPLALGIVLFAGLMSLSRGGITVIFLAAIVSTAICYWASSISGRFWACWRPRAC